MSRNPSVAWGFFFIISQGEAGLGHQKPYFQRGERGGGGGGHVRPGTPPWGRRCLRPRWKQNGIRRARICKSERERCGRKRTQADTHSSHHHLHSRFLKSSHISVTIATLLCLLFHSCFFFFPPLKKKSISPSLILSLS